MNSAEVIADELDMTDIQPVVLAGVDLASMPTARQLLRLAVTKPRRLLVSIDRDVPMTPTVRATQLFAADRVDLVALPWESLGVMVLKAYMRNEWDGTWLTREPRPANEPR